jgi:hypothetical protein
MTKEADVINIAVLLVHGTQVLDITGRVVAR